MIGTPRQMQRRIVTRLQPLELWTGVAAIMQNLALKVVAANSIVVI